MALRAAPLGEGWFTPHHTVDASLAPLQLQGIHILNYIDDWLILAQSLEQAIQHQDAVLARMKELGLRLNAKKSVLSPLQRTTYLGLVWDSTTMQAHLSPARIDSILIAVRRVREGQSLTVKQFQRLLGLMAAASNVIPFGLLYMRPLQWWLRTIGFSPRGNPLRMIMVTRRCLRALDVVKTMIPVSSSSVGGSLSLRNTNDRRLPHGLGSGHEWPLCPRSVGRSPSHVAHQLPGDAGCVSSAETLPSRPQGPQILLWAQGKLLSLRAVYIPGHLNQGADILSRQGLRPGEWRLLPQSVELL
ncbi:hypothetical protein QQF64_011214 [Cirrhinus molitorella]|uniref:ribonuclease H n=1 Tax=Cirrhinus molitorella TaxID=172907 RepID=A0ABR3LZI9_9TELE